MNNSSVGIPGDSGLYAVDSLLECPVYYYTWTLIGDATFNNGNQIIYTNGNVTNVNFGFGFTTAYLCVAGITSFGMMSDTVCMVINAPVGINENNDFINSFFYHPQSGHVEIQFNDSYKYNAAIKLHDITGRQIPFTQTISEKNKIIIVPAATLTNGIYFIDIAGHSIRKTLKFIKTE